MDLIVFNAIWMTFNLLLAVAAAILGLLVLNTKSKLLKIVFGILWIAFIPNTIYILTDLYHLWADWMQVYGVAKILLVGEYSLLVIGGIILFLLNMYLAQNLILETAFGRRNNDKLFLTLLNFFIAFGVILGRFQRTNSWDIFLHTNRFLFDLFRTITSVELMLFVIAFGIVCNTIYFSLKDVVLKPCKKLSKKYLHEIL